MLSMSLEDGLSVRNSCVIIIIIASCATLSEASVGRNFFPCLTITLSPFTEH